MCSVYTYSMKYVEYMYIKCSYLYSSNFEDCFEDTLVLWWFYDKLSLYLATSDKLSLGRRIRTTTAMWFAADTHSNSPNEYGG